VRRSRTRLESQVRDSAAQLGFALCGFARVPDTLPHAESVRRWIKDGYGASMSYLGRGLKKRLDPQLLVAGVRTVVTVGMPYAPPPVPPHDWRSELRGRIAAYALGPDYHTVVGEKLQHLAEHLTHLAPGTVARAYVDTGPVLEREWAALGGIGWFGRNTNILHTREGSYFLLGEILTTLELEPDPPAVDRCGRCTVCIDRCPTGALATDYRLDARRCISYWTIEWHRSIPAAFRPHLGNWVFGCDECQEVCPWNEKLVRSRGQRAEVEALCPYLPDLLALDDVGYERRFATSAIRRATRPALLRNVAVVLGNTGNPAAVAPLGRALRRQPSALVRAHAAWALGVIGDRPARRALETARRCEPDAAVGAEIAAALAQPG